MRHVAHGVSLEALKVRVVSRAVLHAASSRSHLRRLSTACRLVVCRVIMVVILTVEMVVGGVQDADRRHD